MSNSYAAVSALIFAVVALAHLVRLKPVGGADWATQLCFAVDGDTRSWGKMAVARQGAGQGKN